MIISGLEWKKMKLLVVFFDEIFKSAFFSPNKNWINKHFVLICFRSLSVEFFGFWQTILEDGCQKCNLCLQKIFFWRDDKFLRSIIIFGFWVWSWYFLTFGKNFCIVLKTAFHVSTRFFWGKKRCNKNPNTWFFWTPNGKISKVLWNFLWCPAKMHSMLPEEFLEDWMKFGINFDSFGKNC